MAGETNTWIPLGAVATDLIKRLDIKRAPSEGHRIAADDDTSRADAAGQRTAERGSRRQGRSMRG